MLFIEDLGLRVDVVYELSFGDVGMEQMYFSQGTDMKSEARV